MQARAGAEFATTQRYIHAAEVVVAGVVERTEERLFGPTGKSGRNLSGSRPSETKSPA
jgi:hypothetical protein